MFHKKSVSVPFIFFRVHLGEYEDLRGAGVLFIRRRNTVLPAARKTADRAREPAGIAVRYSNSGKPSGFAIRRIELRENHGGEAGVRFHVRN